MENNKENEKQRRIKLEIRLRIAVIGLIAFGGAFVTFIIKRILDIIAN